MAKGRLLGTLVSCSAVTYPALWDFLVLCSAFLLKGGNVSSKTLATGATVKGVA